MSKLSSLLISLFIAIILCMSCNHQLENRNPEQVIKDYYTAINTADFNRIAGCISDSITTNEMEFLLTRNKKELYIQFQWDSVFQPEYKILEIKKDSDAYEATLWKICKRVDFLQDTAITFKEMIYFKDARITRIQLTEYIGLNFDKWQYRTEALIAWVDQNHPELSGFNNDLTKRGAQNYMTAVDLWKKATIPEK